MPRGGKRQGTAGANYSNRSDLALGPRKLPVTTAPGQGYGAQTEQAQAQQTVPMASGPLPQPPDMMAQAQQFTPPPVVAMGAPSNNPGEHVMTGAPTGIGQDIPTQAPQQADPVLKGVALLNALGDAASPQVRAIRDVLSAQQQNAAAP